MPDEFVRPICFNDKPLEVNKNEMKLLLMNSNRNGIFGMLDAYKEGDQVKIIEGVLQDMHGKIIFINEKKRKVKVEINLFNRKMCVSLGMNLIV